jgi:hypothetical protein
MAPKNIIARVKVDSFPLNNTQALWSVRVYGSRGLIGFTADIGLYNKKHLLGGCVENKDFIGGILWTYAAGH